MYSWGTFLGKDLWFRFTPPHQFFCQRLILLIQLVRNWLWKSLLFFFHFSREIKCGHVNMDGLSYWQVKSWSFRCRHVCQKVVSLGGKVRCFSTMQFLSSCPWERPIVSPKHRGAPRRYVRRQRSAWCETSVDTCHWDPCFRTWQTVSWAGIILD